MRLTLEEMIEGMSPEEVTGLLFDLTGHALPLLDEERKQDFILRLVGRAGDAKTGSMARL
jgi:hypothetical protein